VHLKAFDELEKAILNVLMNEDFFDSCIWRAGNSGQKGWGLSFEIISYLDNYLKLENVFCIEAPVEGCDGNPDLFPKTWWKLGLLLD